MFFTAGKDGKIKQWDADSFERILTLEGGHIGEVKLFRLTNIFDLVRDEIRMIGMEPEYKP